MKGRVPLGRDVQWEHPFIHKVEWAAFFPPNGWVSRGGGGGRNTIAQAEIPVPANTNDTLPVASSPNVYPIEAHPRLL
jgi:hypothetical protein